MKRPRGEGWRDPLGLAVLLIALALLAAVWHGAEPAPSLVVAHWHAIPVAR